MRGDIEIEGGRAQDRCRALGADYANHSNAGDVKWGLVTYALICSVCRMVSMDPLHHDRCSGKNVPSLGCPYGLLSALVSRCAHSAAGAAIPVTLR